MSFLSKYSRKLESDITTSFLRGALAISMRTFNISAGAYFDANYFARGDEKRDASSQPVFERRFFPRAVLLGVTGRRGAGNTRVHNRRKHYCDRFITKEFHRNLLAGAQELCRRANHLGWNRNLIESVRTHEGATVAIRIEELHLPPINGQILQPLLRTKVRLPSTPAAHVDHLGFHHTAHFCGASFRFQLQHFVDLTFDTYDHPFMQFGRDHHDCASCGEKSLRTATPQPMARSIVLS